MLIVYDTRTNNVKRFVNKTTYNAIKIENELIVNESFVLVTYTTGNGVVPDSTIDFLENNKKFIVGVSSSGNRNFGDMYANAADVISTKYNVPIISKFELSGSKRDIEYFTEKVREIERESDIVK